MEGRHRPLAVFHVANASVSRCRVADRLTYSDAASSTWMPTHWLFQNRGNPPVGQPLPSTVTGIMVGFAVVERQYARAVPVERARAAKLRIVVTVRCVITLLSSLLSSSLA